MRQVAPVGAPQFLFGITQHPAKCLVRPDNASVQAGRRHAKRRVLENLSKTLFAFPQLAFHLQPRADVAGDGGDAYDFAAGISYRRVGNADIAEGTVLLSADRFERADGETGPDPVEAFLHFVGAVGRSQHGNTLSDGFLTGITKQLFAAEVPADDAPVQAHTVNRVV